MGGAGTRHIYLLYAILKKKRKPHISALVHLFTTRHQALALASTARDRVHSGRARLCYVLLC